MKRQLIFDTIAKHLLAQGIKCIKGKFCAYMNAESDTKCAIGALIPVTRYKETIEGLPLCNKEVLEAIDPKYGVDLKPADINVEDYFFLSALRNLHDHKKPEEWKPSLQTFAQKHNLKMIED